MINIIIIAIWCKIWDWGEENGQNCPREAASRHWYCCLLESPEWNPVLYSLINHPCYEGDINLLSHPPLRNEERIETESPGVRISLPQRSGGGLKNLPKDVGFFILLWNLLSLKEVKQIGDQTWGPSCHSPKGSLSQCWKCCQRKAPETQEARGGGQLFSRKNNHEEAVSISYRYWNLLTPFNM